MLRKKIGIGYFCKKKDEKPRNFVRFACEKYKKSRNEEKTKFN